VYSIEQYVVAVAKVCYILYYICLNDAVATITICETDEKYQTVHFLLRMHLYPKSLTTTAVIANRGS
jgi:hypothetical protein